MTVEAAVMYIRNAQRSGRIADDLSSASASDVFLGADKTSAAHIYKFDWPPRKLEGAGWPLSHGGPHGLSSTQMG